MRNLIPTFPREICFPRRRLIKTESEFYKAINQNNKLTNVYFSLYMCNGERNFDNTHIDKIYFDFDVDKNDIENIVKEKKINVQEATLQQQDEIIKQVKRFSDYLKEKSFKPLICFSGKKGFHIYIFTTNYENIVHKRDCIYNAYKYFKDTLKITPDEHCKDLRRISRVPNSWHMKGKRYCIPITRHDLSKGFNEVKEKAKNQNFDFRYYGDNLFDITQFDYKSFNGVNGDIPEYDYEIKDVDKAIKRFLPCVQQWLLNIDNSGTYKARYYFAIYCRDMELPKTLCNKLARKYFGKVKRSDGLVTNYQHFVQVHALEYAYERGDLFPNCGSLYQEGLCKGKCKKMNPKGSPLYK